jgi:serine carboxypeptidase-like clade 1
MVMQWFTDHPQYLSNHFYLAGDSYAGKVIPLIAQDISEGINYLFVSTPYAHFRK